jgi:hypothetical protein
MAGACADASAGGLGFVASVRTSGNQTVIDVFVGVSNASDRFLNVYDLSASGIFVQRPGLVSKTWKPDTAGLSNTRNTSDDSFMTAGTAWGSAYGGEYYPSSNTNGDPNFTGTSWNATPTSAAATTVPILAGWYTGDPTSVDNNAESLAGLIGRVNGTGATGANYGIWCAHFVLNSQQNSSFSFSAFSSVKDGVTGQTTGLSSSITLPILNDPDGDGVADPVDNCPTVPNPTQADCNENGIGEACETFTDCNQTGLPDSCDIASGTSDDANTNAVPDECEVDCNMNGISDLAEVFSGAMPDCNGDRIPDTCQGAVLVSESTPNLGEPSGDEVRAFTFAAVPFAESSVTITIDVRGDLNGSTEYVDVRLNDSAPRRFFQNNGNSCPITPDRATITLTRSEYNDLTAATGALTVAMTCPPTVDPTECKGNGMTAFALSYVGISPKKGDCNGNRRLDACETGDGNIPDSCDVARGGFADCDGNGSPDVCQIAADPTLDCDGNGALDSCDLATKGAEIDCDGNGRIDACQVDEVPGIDCNGNDRPDSCDVATNGGSADIDSNGVPDECQTVTVPFNFATIQAAIDAAPSNEMRIILVEPGAYVENIDFRGKPVRVRGVHENMTSLTGAPGVTKSVVTFSGGEPAIAALEHIRVTGGATGSPFPGAPQFQVGGGVFGYSSAASISHCIIEGNVASFGAGIYLWNSTGRVQFCSIRNNNAGADGGGALLFGGTPTMSDCSVVNNRANSRGGGLHLVSGVQLVERVDVSKNHSDNVVGGISWVPNENPAHFLRLVDVSVQNNTAAIVQGGIGVLQTDSSVRMSVQNSVACSNLPRPNVVGRFDDLGGNEICDCLGDVNLDGLVNGADLSLVLSSWGPCGGVCPYDLNDDGIVNGSDLSKVLSEWGVCGN